MWDLWIQLPRMDNFYEGMHVGFAGFLINLPTELCSQLDILFSFLKLLSGIWVFII